MRISFHIFCLVFSLVVIHSPGIPETRIKFLTDTLKFRIQYSPLASAKIQMCSTFDKTQSQNKLIIRSEMKTGKLTSLLFNVNNTYETLVDLDTWLPIKLEKEVIQTNITQNFMIIFDHDQCQAKTTDGKSWEITKNSIDLFTMIYKLRFQNLYPGQIIDMVLDLESELWQISGFIEGPDIYEELSSKYDLTRIELYFKPFKKMFCKRKWKTDLLINRLSQENTKLVIFLGPPPRKLPFLIRFGHDETNVEMKLLNN